MTTVYRIEDKATHVGPYHHGLRFTPWGEVMEATPIARRMNDLHSEAGNRPAWSLDGIDAQGGAWVSGGESIEAIEDWFGPFLPELFELGFELVSYEVDEWSIQRGISGQQLAFIPNDTRKVIDREEVNV